jgi:phage baseplate assembly protein W
MALRPSREIAFPFRIGPDGGIAYVEDPYRTALQHLVQLILTRPGERIMLPGFGTEAANLLFDNINEVTGVELAMRVTAAIALWEPAIKIHDIRPSLRAMGEGALTLTIQFSVPPREEILSTVVEVGGAVRGEIGG